jgi:exodeoxyribonuclease VII large subunit
MMQLFGNAEGERVLGLEELARMIEGVISDSFGRGYWIKAEMARLNLYPESGHCYPDLVEKDGRTIKAQMRGTIWAGNYQRIAKQFLDVTREPLRDGLQILFFATVKFHPQYGLSLQISDIDPSYTLGQMARDRMETIRRLREEGLFDKNRSLDFPVLPKRIAVISVQTSKGYSDFMNILESQAAEFHFGVMLFPALLQGDKAVDSILGQLKTIRKLKGHFDVAAIIRGGGGDVGLSCYDDYRLAKEVATFPIPVLTGIGHSTNETVVEMVAARNKITPTDVAYSLVEHFRGLAGRLQEIGDILSEFSRELFEDQKLLLKNLAGRLQEETFHHMEAQRSRMEVLFKLISIDISAYTERKKATLLLAESSIRLLDPRNTLKRGYSITLLNNKPLRDASQASAGDIITTELYQGKISSTVNKKEE